jgi:hypothetical protein
MNIKNLKIKDVICVIGITKDMLRDPKFKNNNNVHNTLDVFELELKRRKCMEK